jgi:hypothetical protein
VAIATAKQHNRIDDHQQPMHVLCKKAHKSTAPNLQLQQALHHISQSQAKGCKQQQPHVNITSYITLGRELRLNGCGHYGTHTY